MEPRTSGPACFSSLFPTPTAAPYGSNRGGASDHGPERLSLVFRGTPEHELAACGAVLLAAWSGESGESSGAAGPPDWRRTMRALFPGRCPDTLEWDRCRTAVVRLWDSMHMAGTRTAWEPDGPRNTFPATQPPPFAVETTLASLVS